MLSKRYTIVLADRTTGVVRRFTVSLRPVLIAVVTVVTLPILIGTGAALKARYDVSHIFRVERHARARERQLPRRDRTARRPDHGAADGDVGPRREGRARPVAAELDGQAAGGGEEPRDGRSDRERPRSRS